MECMQLQALELTDTGTDASIRRWLRLLFTRELSMPDALRLWDGLFACDPTFDLAQWICVAMLIRIRNKRKPCTFIHRWHLKTQ
jgi:TBC1 domain family protein 5